MHPGNALKALLIFMGACFGAVVSQDYFPTPVKAYAAVLGAGAAALLAYLLNPRGPNGGPPTPVTVTNTESNPVPTDPQG